MAIEFIRYAAKNLEPNEKILFQTRTHWIILLNPVATILVGLIALGWATNGEGLSYERFASDPFSTFFENPWIALIPISALAIVQGMVLFVRRFVALIASEMTVTTRRVIDKEGFIWRNANEIDARKLEGSELVDQSWLGQLLDYGTVSINGVGGKRITLPFACSPLEVRRQVSRLIAHYSRNTNGRSSHNPKARETTAT